MAFCQRICSESQRHPITQAAIRAGYSEKTARAIASENLKKPEVAAALESERKRFHNRLNAVALQVVEELSKLAFSDFSKAFGEEGILPPDEWPVELWDF